MSSLISESTGKALVAASVVGMTLQIVKEMAGVMKLRAELFDSEEFKARPEFKELNEKFNKQYGQDIKMGYPDMGNGPIAALLPFEDWTRFAIAQRTHYNYVEVSALATGLLLVNAQDKPVLAGVSGIVFLLGRGLYASGYKKKGPKGRGVGAIVADVALLVLLGGALHSALSHSGAISAVSKLFKK